MEAYTRQNDVSAADLQFRERLKFFAGQDGGERLRIRPHHSSVHALLQRAKFIAQRRIMLSFSRCRFWNCARSRQPLLQPGSQLLRVRESKKRLQALELGSTSAVSPPSRSARVDIRPAMPARCLQFPPHALYGFRRLAVITHRGIPRLHGMGGDLLRAPEEMAASIRGRRRSSRW